MFKAVMLLVDSCSGELSRGRNSHWTDWARGLAKRTAADEYNVIEAEPQLVRIDS